MAQKKSNEQQAHYLRVLFGYLFPSFTRSRVLPEDHCKEDPLQLLYGMGSWRGINQELTNY